MEVGSRGARLGSALLAHIGGAGSEGTCTVWSQVGRQSWFFILLLTGTCPRLGWVCGTVQLHVLPAFTAALPQKGQQGGTGREGCAGQGTGTRGCGDTGTQGYIHPKPARVGGEEQEAAELHQLLGNSPADPSCQKSFFSITDAPSFSRPSSCTRLPRASKVPG